MKARRQLLPVLSSLLLLLSSPACRKPETVQRQAQTVFAVPVVMPRVEPLVQWFPVTTRLRAPMVPVLPTVAARFLRFTVREGQQVQKDQVVALLDRSLPGLKYQEVKVLAPATGRIHLLDLDPGTPVSPTVPLAQIQEAGPLKFTLYLPEVYHDALRPGDRIRVVVGQDTLWARILRVAPAIDPMIGAREVLGTLEGASGSVVPGQTARVLVPVARRDSALVLPPEAVQGEVAHFVYVVRGGRAHKVPVRIGLYTLEAVEILEGVTEHDTVVALPVANLKEGSPVKVVW